MRHQLLRVELESVCCGLCRVHTLRELVRSPASEHYGIHPEAQNCLFNNINRFILGFIISHPLSTLLCSSFASNFRFLSRISLANDMSHFFSSSWSSNTLDFAIYSIVMGSSPSTRPRWPAANKCSCTSSLILTAISANSL